MSESFVDRYKDSIGRSVEYFAYEAFEDSNLEFLLEESEERISYVDGLYLGETEQTLYFFRIRKLEKFDCILKTVRRLSIHQL